MTSEKQYSGYLASHGIAIGDLLDISCTCGTRFLLRIPEFLQAGGLEKLIIACPSACANGGDLSNFKFQISKADPAKEFDVHRKCERCGVEYAANGTAIRRPCCYIENTRELMYGVYSEVLSAIESSPPSGLPRARVEELLSKTVSTFDGVMRRSLEIANLNLERFGRELLPAASSFQNLDALVDWPRPRIKLFDCLSPDEYQQLRLAFQKRHLCVHQLGVVDKKFIAKTGDKTAVEGKKVEISIGEVLRASRLASNVVVHFFGHWLS